MEPARAIVIQRSADRGKLRVDCPLHGHCEWSCWKQSASGIMWQWDGDAENPTISPSIDCQAGCGRHFIITKGIGQ